MGVLTVSWKLVSFQWLPEQADLAVLGQIIFQRQNRTSQDVLKGRSLSAPAPTPFMGTRGLAFHMKMGSTWVPLRRIFLSHSQVKRFFFQGKVHYFGTKVFCFIELAFRQSFQTWDVKTTECWWFALSETKVLEFCMSLWFFKGKWCCLPYGYHILLHAPIVLHKDGWQPGQLFMKGFYSFLCSTLHLRFK